jgi:hypothetical protein
MLLIMPQTASIILYLCYNDSPQQGSYAASELWLFPLQVLQPLFNYVAEQVGLMGGMKEEPALRVGYDDINESACSNQVRAASQ